MSAHITYGLRRQPLLTLVMALELVVLANSAARASVQHEWVPEYMFGVPALAAGELRLNRPVLCDRSWDGHIGSDCTAPRVMPTLRGAREPEPPRGKHLIDAFNSPLARLLPSERLQLGMPDARFVMLFNERGNNECRRADLRNDPGRAGSSDWADPFGLHRARFSVGVAVLSGSMRELARGPVESINRCRALMDCRLLREPPGPAEGEVGNGLGTSTGAVWASCLCQQRGKPFERYERGAETMAIGPLHLQCASATKRAPSSGRHAKPSVREGTCALRARLLSDSLGGYLFVSKELAPALGVAGGPRNRNLLPFWYRGRMHVLWGLSQSAGTTPKMAMVAVNASLVKGQSINGGPAFLGFSPADVGPPHRLLPLVRPEQLAMPTAATRATSETAGAMDGVARPPASLNATAVGRFAVPARAPHLEQWYSHRLHLSVGPLLLRDSAELLVLMHRHEVGPGASTMTLGPAANSVANLSAASRAQLAGTQPTLWGHHYTQLMLTLDARPPFAVRRVGPEWCFPALKTSTSRPDDCESIQFVCGMELTQISPAHLSRTAAKQGRSDVRSKSYSSSEKREALRFSYGVNDCATGIAEVLLDEALRGLRSVD